MLGRVGIFSSKISLMGRSCRPSTVKVSSRSYQLRRTSQPDGKVVMYGIIGAQVAIFCGWKVAETNRNMWRTMMRHFTVSKDGVMRHLRVHTLFTAMLSHQDFMHLFVNTFTLYFFGLEMLSVLGIVKFLQLYIGGGIFSSLCHVGFQGRQNGMGASGGVYAVLINSIIMFPSRTILLYGLLPMPAWLLGIGIVGNDLYGTTKSGYSSTGHAAHLGGVVYGAGFYAALRMGRRF